MLRPKVLPKLLEQANTSGVTATLLLNKDGALLAAAAAPAAQEHVPVVAAIYCNIWETYSQQPGLNVLLVECEKGKVAMTEVTEDFYIVLYGDETAQFGMMKRKAELLKEALQEPLSKLGGTKK